MIMKKVLFVIPSITQTNGVCSFVFNYLKYLDKKAFSFTILATDLRPSPYYIELAKQLDVKLVLTKNPGEVGFRRWHYDLKKFFEQNHSFDIIYSNVPNQSIFIFKLAKKYGIKKMAIHSHSTSAADKALNRIRNYFLNRLMLKYATKCFACSQAAGVALYGKRSFEIINNAIDYSKFSFNEEYRSLIREKYNIKESEKIVGFVGRFVPQKNVSYFINLAQKTDENIRYLLIGNGPLKEEIMTSINRLNLGNKFIFVEECDCVEKYYCAMDIFALPSLYEGLPVSGIEAQVNGLPCLFSNAITFEASISNKAFFLPLIDEDLWISKIQNLSFDNREQITNDKYDIVKQAKIFNNVLELM